MKRLYQRYLERKCQKRGHQWFGTGQSEFIVSVEICLRCGVFRHRKPWGQCLGEHPLADHYDDEGNVVMTVGNCRGPR